MEIHPPVPETESDAADAFTSEPPPTVYVTFTGANRTTYTGAPIDVKGWWEIHGLDFPAAVEIAHAMTSDLHHSVRVHHDMPWQRLTAGCTYVIIAGTPPRTHVIKSEVSRAGA